MQRNGHTRRIRFVLQSSILAAWAMEIDLDNLNDILSDASDMINRFAEIALCSTTMKTNSSEVSTYTTFSAMQVLMWALWTSCSETEEAKEELQEYENVVMGLDGSVKAEYDSHQESWRKARETIFVHVSQALSKICSVKNVGILLKRVVEEARKSVIMLRHTILDSSENEFEYGLEFISCVQLDFKKDGFTSYVVFHLLIQNPN